MLILLLCLFLFLLLIGVPIGFAMLGSAMLVIGVDGIPVSVVAQRVATSVQSFPLLAVPLFTLAGALMNESGISERLFAFTRAFVGHIRGGLAIATVFACGIFGAMSGASTAAASVMSKIAMPEIAIVTRQLIAIMEGERPEEMGEWV
jgi:TRAP-type mannitol/chloroaromatic compound transport system permease large subunit